MIAAFFLATSVPAPVKFSALVLIAEATSLQNWPPPVALTLDVGAAPPDVVAAALLVAAVEAPADVAEALPPPAEVAAEAAAEVVPATDVVVITLVPAEPADLLLPPQAEVVTRATETMTASGPLVRRVAALMSVPFVGLGPGSMVMSVAVQVSVRTPPQEDDDDDRGHIGLG